MHDFGLGQATLVLVKVMEFQCLRLGSRPPFTADVWAHYHATPRGTAVTEVAMGQVLLVGFLVCHVQLETVVPHFI